MALKRCDHIVTSCSIPNSIQLVVVCIEDMVFMNVISLNCPTESGGTTMYRPRPIQATPSINLHTSYPSIEKAHIIAT